MAQINHWYTFLVCKVRFCVLKYIIFFPRIDLLSKYQVTLEKKKQSEDERDRIVKKSPEIQQNQQRMSVIRKELDEIERQLGRFFFNVLNQMASCFPQTWSILSSYFAEPCQKKMKNNTDISETFMQLLTFCSLKLSMYSADQNFRHTFAFREFSLFS